MMTVGYIVWGLDDLGILDQLQWVHDQGVPAVGFHSTPTLAPDRGLDVYRTTREEMDRLRALVPQFEAVEVHAPFDGNYDVCLTSPNPQIRVASLMTLQQHLRFAAEIGARVMTIHAGVSRAASVPDGRREALRETLPALDALAAEHGVPVAVEVSDHFLDLRDFALLDELECEHLGICLDVGHIRFEFGGRPAHEVYGTIPDCIRIFGERLSHVHLHDSKDGSDHRGLGDGDCDIDGVLAALLETGYQGFINCEPSPVHVPPRAMPGQVWEVQRRLRELGVE